MLGMEDPLDGVETLVVAMRTKTGSVKKIKAGRG